MINPTSGISNYSSFNVANFGKKIKQHCLDLFWKKNKQYTIDDPKALKVIDFFSKELSSSYNQRLILGATALSTQPFIDLHNKSVDEKTRKVSVCRTVAKILVGTATGYLIRKGCVKGIDAFTKLPKDVPPNAMFKNLRSFLLPTIEYTADQLAQYKNTLGTLMALGIMVFTNFLIDAPLTKLFTNIFLKGVENNEK